MITPKLKRRVAARRVALGLIVAGMPGALAPADATSAQPYPNHKPLSGNHPGSYTLPAANSLPRAALPYPNHKPVRGNYPGSYASNPAAPAHQPSSGFDWLAAVAGAAAMLGLILLLAAAKATTRNVRRRRDEGPIVLKIRDDTPGVG